jgi:UDP-3-O-[3-hydroxymyristoyl] glucosamine N-acyltransferase
MAGASLGELAARFGLTLRGNPEVVVHSVATLQGATEGTLSFLANRKYQRHLATTSASAVVVDAATAEACPVAALVSPNPYATYARIAAVLHPAPTAVAGIHPTAVVDPSATVAATASVAAHVVIEAGCVIGERAVIGAGCYLGPDSRIGADTRLAPRVTLYAGVTIGARGLIHSGVVLGADGFGLAPDRGGWVKVPQVGGVTIGDDVEIGANTTIDRGAIEDTTIGHDVKLDNQIQIGHNVRIGDHTAIAGCVGVSGSTTIGSRCMIGGAVGIAGHLEIADGVVVTGLTLVSRSLTEAGVYSSATPAMEAGDWRRVVARLRHIDELFDRVRSLEGKGPRPDPE